MPTQSWSSAGTTIAIDETGSGSFTLINQVSSIKGVGGGSIAQVKTTWLSSAAHTYRATIKDPAEIEIELFFDPTDAVHKFLRNSADTPGLGPYTYKVVWPTTGTTSTAVIIGNISDFKGVDAGDVEDNLQASFTIKQTGLPTWVAAT